VPILARRTKPDTSRTRFGQARSGHGHYGHYGQPHESLRHLNWSRAHLAGFHVTRGRWLTLELSDAGGPPCPHCQPTWSARVRSSDFVSRTDRPAAGVSGTRSRWLDQNPESLSASYLKSRAGRTPRHRVGIWGVRINGKCRDIEPAPRNQYDCALSAAQCDPLMVAENKSAWNDIH